MSAVNEIAQWAVLAFLCVFVLGLTRQLGGYITATREMKAESEGPILGKVVPAALLAPPERARLADLMHERGTDWLGLMVGAEDCDGCAELVDGIVEDGLPGGAPFVLLLPQATEQHREHMERVADLVVVDEKRIRQCNVTATPFCMVVDSEFRLVAKAIGKRFESMLDGRRDDEAAVSDGDAISIVRRNGRD